MKKFILTSLFTSLVLSSMLFISCSKSNEDLMKEYQSIGKEIVQATKDGDLVKVEKLVKKGESIENELKSRNLTEEEQEKLSEIEYEISVDLSQVATDKFNSLYN